MKSLCVFCGSGEGKNPAFAAAAAELGRLLAEKNIRLVYGGGRLGMMGILADACIAAGGKTTGIIPRFLVEREVAHSQLDELIIVDTMHQRKQLMLDRSDASLTLPGGFGTLDEFFELVTWRSLGIHSKPVALHNCEGFYDHLLAHFRLLISEAYAAETRVNDIITGNDLSTILAEIENKTKGN